MQEGQQPRLAAEDATTPRKARRTKGPRNTLVPGTREIILDVAEELFAIQGFHGVSIRDIARRADVNSALIHYYFTSKVELFETAWNYLTIMKDVRAKTSRLKGLSHRSLILCLTVSPAAKKDGRISSLF